MPTECTTKGFATPVGGREQVVIVRASGEEGDFAEQQAAVARAYRDALDDLGLPSESAVFRRIFLSDVMNQVPALAGSGLLSEANDPVALSIIEQPPLPHAKIALLAYHVTSQGGVKKRRLGPHHLLAEKNGARHLWSTRLCAARERFPASPEAQTNAVFAELIGALELEGGSLAQHCVRTWLFVKGIDVFYPGLVEARRALFVEQGLTSDTHYIAATGIEGACAHRFDIVAMDAYSQLDLHQNQLLYLNDFSRLCPTHHYGVTFERGASVRYADRTQYFISGTASIDHEGRVLHVGNVRAQLDRALDNVGALLRAGSAGLEDLLYLIVYVRDPADAGVVESALHEQLPDLPIVVVRGVVCRPEWLVEIEGFGVAPTTAPIPNELPHF